MSELEKIDIEGIFPGSTESSLTEEVPTFVRPRLDYQPLPAGTYQMTLRDILKVQRKAYQSDEMEDCLAFDFFEKRSGKRVQKRVRPSTHLKSHCYHLVMQLCSSQYNPEILENNELFWKFIKTFIGKNFLVHVSVSANGRWNNVENVMPMDNL